MLNKERLDFIRKLQREKGLIEVLNLEDAKNMGIIQFGINFKCHQGVMIGTDGFGFQRDEKGELVKFPHQKGVIIGDNVEIRTGTVIARGTMTDTVIGDGTKIGSNVTIGHSAEIGKNVLICPNVVVCGSAEIGDYSTISTGAIIKQGIKIGKNCFIDAQQYIELDKKDGDKVVNG